MSVSFDRREGSRQQRRRLIGTPVSIVCSHLRLPPSFHYTTNHEQDHSSFTVGCHTPSALTGYCLLNLTTHRRADSPMSFDNHQRFNRSQENLRSGLQPVHFGSVPRKKHDSVKSNGLLTPPSSGRNRRVCSEIFGNAIQSVEAQ